jgi:CheY-like chemotaxis protein
MNHILADNGMSVIPVSDPEKALEIISHHKPDVVIFDLKLPKMDGLSMVKKMQGLMPSAPPAFVVTSGDISSAQLSALSSLGVRQRLDKPFGRHELIEVVNRALAEKR